MRKSTLGMIGTFIALALLFGCASAPKFPTPGELVAPSPIEDNSGEFMSPYTSDGVVAKWCDKAVNASAGSAIGGAAGAIVGQQVLKQVPFVGGFLGNTAGKAIGRKMAIEASGGWEYIKETSDLSFNSLDDMAVWLYVTHSTNEHYQAVYKAVGNIYPDFKERYYPAIQAAGRN